MAAKIMTMKELARLRQEAGRFGDVALGRRSTLRVIDSHRRLIELAATAFNFSAEDIHHFLKYAAEAEGIDPAAARCMIAEFESLRDA
ncbi:MAG: hypothetical protein ABIL58_20060 [Pseudomonadota bacterium]